MDIDQKYDPARSQITDSTLCDWLSGEIVDSLSSVPGIGQKSVQKLEEKNIFTTFQLLGVFLTLRAPLMDKQTHCNAVWHWLGEAGVDSHRADVVTSLVEKIELWLPELYI